MPKHRQDSQIVVWKWEQGLCCCRCRDSSLGWKCASVLFAFVSTKVLTQISCVRFRLPDSSGCWGVSCSICPYLAAALLLSGKWSPLARAAKSTSLLLGCFTLQADVEIEIVSYVTVCHFIASASQPYFILN